MRNIRLIIEIIENRTYASRVHVPHLRTATGPFIHGESVFSGRPGLSHSGRFAASNKTTKVLSQRARGSRETLFIYFILLILFIYFILLIFYLFYFINFIYLFYFINFINSIQFRYLFILLVQFNFVTYVRPLKTPAHDDCQSPLPGQVGLALSQ